MSGLSRREFLERLAAAYAGSMMIGCSRKRDVFVREGVCIHVLHPQEFIPAPLTEKIAGPPTPRRADQTYFNIGLPELALCESRTPLLDRFQYFWPFSRTDFETLQNTITIRYQRATLSAAREVAEFAAYLREHRSGPAANAGWSVIFIWNDFTRQWSPEVAAACRQSAVQEFVVFKDPTQPPYLCEYPAKQKGFKRPPP